MRRSRAVEGALLAIGAAGVKREAAAARTRAAKDWHRHRACRAGLCRWLSRQRYSAELRRRQ
eukprot:4756205-Prymnesium_polylepis.1